MRDTSFAAAALQARIHQSLTGVERLALAWDMSVTAHDLALARLRAQHAEWSEQDCRRELLRYAFSGGKLPPPLQ